MDLNIKVIRKYFKEEYTIGKMFIYDELFCDVLEDKDRGLTDDMSLSQIKKNKVYAKTAIPYGRYEVKPYFWPKYRKVYPWLQNVKGFTGILCHCGRTADNSSGCLLLGENKIKGGLINGEKYVRKLTEIVQECEKRGEKVYITICKE